MPQHHHEIAIFVECLSKHFFVAKKEEGLLAAIKGFFHRNWEKVSAVQNVSFTVRKGEFVGLLGPNGAGKTTIVKMLSGILSPSDGRCEVLGFVPLERKRVFLKKISLVMGQKSQLIWDLPPSDSFHAHAVMYDICRADLTQRVHSLAEMLDVQNVLNTPSRQLSLGERMKCELILAFLHKPEILFLDEPTIGLDAASQIKIWDFLQTQKKLQETTVIITSHYAQDIDVLCPRVLLINKGRLCFDGEFGELISFAEPEKRISLTLAENINLKQKNLVEKTIGKIPTYTNSRQFTFFISSSIANKVLRDLVSVLPVQQIALEEAGLSAMFAKSIDMKNEEVVIRKLASKIKKGHLSRLPDLG